MICEENNKPSKVDEYINFNAEQELKDIKNLTISFREKFFTKTLVNELINKNKEKDRIMTFYELYESIILEEKRINEENQRRIETEKKKLENLEQKKLKAMNLEKKKIPKNETNVNDKLAKEQSLDIKLVEENYIKLNNNNTSLLEISNYKNSVANSNFNDVILNNSMDNLIKVKDDNTKDKVTSVKEVEKENTNEIENEDINCGNYYDDDLNFLVEQKARKKYESDCNNTDVRIDNSNKNENNKIVKVKDKLVSTNHGKNSNINTNKKIIDNNEIIEKELKSENCKKELIIKPEENCKLSTKSILKNKIENIKNKNLDITHKNMRSNNESNSIENKVYINDKKHNIVQHDIENKKKSYKESKKK